MEYFLFVDSFYLYLDKKPLLIINKFDLHFYPFILKKKKKPVVFPA